MTNVTFQLSQRRAPCQTPGDRAWRRRREAWQEHTHGPPESLEYSGGHFFLQGQEARLVGDIRERFDMVRRGA